MGTKFFTKKFAQQNIIELREQVQKPGLIWSRTPHARAENTMAHCGVAAFLTLGLSSLGLGDGISFLIVIAAGFVWELRLPPFNKSRPPRVLEFPLGL